MRRVVCLALLLLASCDGCERGKTDAAPSASASAAASSPPSPELGELVRAEHTRSAKAIAPEALSSRDVRVRRIAARALARIADERSAKLLDGALADEDPGVVSWAAYGLGYACKGREPATVRALVARAASLPPDPTGAAAPSLGDVWPPIASIADALARCATIEAEHTLRVWLEGPRERAEAAALALGRLASRSKRLDDASIVALLDAASRPEQPLDHALFAFSRLTGLAEPVQERLLAVAKESLRADGQRRAYAVRALGRAGSEATPLLVAIVTDPKASAPTRAIAARELTRLGEAGQPALFEALAKLATELPSDDVLLSPAWLPWIAVLESLTTVPRERRELLEQLAELPLAEGSKPAARRRRVELRCRAAALLAGTASLYPRLVKCDPDVDGRTGRLAVLRVLGKGPLGGARHRRWLELASARDPIVREAALELLASHAEVPRAWEPLAAALKSGHAGTVAVAARVLADHPDRASSDKPSEPAAAVRPETAIVDSLTAAFAAKWPEDALETRAALVDAAGALQVLSLKPAVAKHCKGDHPTLRHAAEKALRLLGERKASCRQGEPATAPKTLGLALPDELRLVLSTDAGELTLTLDARLAPVTAQRVAELARAGFYDGVVFHRVVPGFVVQFGDPGGDGFGGSGREPLRCETSPASFGAGAVGVALAGRDTGSSQLFVTLAPYPHLDGDYPLIGRAGPGWERLAQGDAITKVRVVE